MFKKPRRELCRVKVSGIEDRSIVLCRLAAVCREGHARLHLCAQTRNGQLDQLIRQIPVSHRLKNFGVIYSAKLSSGMSLCVRIRI